MDPLSPAEIEHFIEKGYVAVPRTFSKETAALCMQDIQKYMQERKGIDFENPESFPKSNSDFEHGCLQDIFPLSESPWKGVMTQRYMGSLTQLLGAEELWTPPTAMGWFAITYPGIDDRSAGYRWRQDRGNWHIDGIFDHFPDQQALSLFQIVLFTDIESRKSGTALVPGSHKFVSQLLHDNKDNGVPDSTVKKAIREVYSLEKWNKGEFEVIDIHGEAGTVWFCHPFLVHATGLNIGETIRVISNPNIAYKDKMRIYTDHSDESVSPIELAIRKSLV